MRQNKVMTKSNAKDKSKPAMRKKRTQTAEGWRRSVNKLWQKKQQNSD